MAAETSKATSSADSYIGSLISLTSKSEIRYEGILYSINTDEASIGLRNVRSFGTEGRKKDGPQVAPSDKVYEYILFRGSDIKDLQVKSSPPIQASSLSSIDNDPAIIQSHYPQPASTAPNLPPAVTSFSADVNVHAPHLAPPVSGFQGGLPLYQPGGSLGSWGPSPPGANGAGLAMPMYWPGFYGPSNGLPHMAQQTLLRPPPGLSMPSSLQQPMLYPGLNTPSISSGATNLTGPNLPDIPPSLMPSSTTSTIPTSTSLPQTSLAPVLSTSLASETFPGSMDPKALNFTHLPTISLPPVSLLTASAADTGVIVPVASNVVDVVSSSSLPNLSISQTIGSTVSSVPSQTEIPTPSLVTPDQLMKSEQIPTLSSPSEVQKDVEVVQVSSSSSSQPKPPAQKEAQPPILPLPPQSRAFRKPNGPPLQHHNYNCRGRGRGTGKGRGSSGSRLVTKFTEDFDFESMNEKFNKDEVWGHLGKGNKSHEGVATADDGDASEEESEDVPKVDVKPVYNKDNFFDMLSCNTIDNDSQNGRLRFSEQLKLDAETFGDFVRYRGGRGGRWPGRGGRSRGSYYGRGYGYNNGRGRGRGIPNRLS